jgi:fucose permease
VERQSVGEHRLLVAGSASFFAVGIAIVLPGTLLPVFVETLHLTWAEAGTFLAAQPLGHLFTVAAVAVFLSAVPPRTCAMAGFIPLTLALLWLGSVRSLQTAWFAMLLSGVGIGLIETGTNSELLRTAPKTSRALNLTHLFFGLACVAGPPLASRAVHATNPLLVPFCGAALLTFAAGSLWLRYRAPLRPFQRSAREEKVRTGGLPFLAVSMALYVGAEVGLGSWFTQYATSVLTMSLSTAGLGVAAYWGGLTAGRLALALLSRTTTPRFVLQLAIGSAISSGALLSVREPAFLVVLAALTGAALAGIFPGILALAARESGGNSARIVSILLLAAGSGQILFPWAMGGFANWFGLSRAMWAYPLLCAALACSLLIYGRSVPKRFPRGAN